MAEAQVTVFSVAVDAAPLAALTHLLDDDERARASRFAAVRHGSRFVAAHSALRLVLAAAIDLPPREIRIHHGSTGKPFLPDYPGIEFNLSHSAGHALIAISPGRPVGIDLEAIQGDINAVALSERFFSPAERAELAALPAEQLIPGFYNGWTRKEAYLKGRGTGIGAGLDHFDVTLAPERPAVLRADRREPDAVTKWSIADLPAPQGYAAALACNGPTPAVNYRTFAWS